MPKSKILILTLSHGASHRRAATALEKALLTLQPDVKVEVVDALAHCAGWFRAYYNSYEIPLKYWPSLWAWIEGIQHQSTSTGPGWLYRRGARPLYRFIQSFGPDIVIATEVGMCELAALFKREGGTRFMLVGATAGVDLDHPWAQPEVDFYPVFPGQLPRQLEADGVPSEKILPCGTPIAPGFSPSPDRAKLRSRLQVASDIPLLLVLFGGTGFGRPRRIIAELRKIRRPLQVVFISGRNRRLEETLRSLCRGEPRYRVLGWADNIHEWMAAADLLLSKPGGATVVEAINSGLPILAFDPLPGAERRACDLIEENQFGRWVREPADLAPAIEVLLTFPEELARYREHALEMARPNAALDAARAILELWQTRFSTEAKSG